MKAMPRCGMGLFDRFRNKATTTQPELRQVEATLYEGFDTLEVVGESHYQDALWHIVGGRTADHVRKSINAILIPEPNNTYDANAIAVQISGPSHALTVGYLSRDDAAAIGPGLRHLMARSGKYVALNGVITGGGQRANGLGFLGVFLAYDPADFGIEPEPARAVGIHGGLSAADQAVDGSYSLDWFSGLSDDTARRLGQLRQLAKTETSPISRHFVLTELESCLYRCRDVFNEALPEYAQWAEQHHTEMVSGTRDALLAKLGCIPFLEFYKQSSIIAAKAKDFGAALEWAQRGLDVYGNHAAKDEWVEDLQKRVDKCTVQLAKAAAPTREKPSQPAQ